MLTNQWHYIYSTVQTSPLANSNYFLSSKTEILYSLNNNLPVLPPPVPSNLQYVFLLYDLFILGTSFIYIK